MNTDMTGDDALPRHPIPRLLIRLPLQEDESVVSFLQRHAKANRAARMRDLLQLLEQLSGEPIRDVSDVVLSRAVLHAVEWLTGLSEGALASRHLAPLQASHVRSGPRIWERSTRLDARQAVCPLCLAETGYGRVDWEFVLAPVCRVHRVALLDTCPSCGGPLRHGRTTIGACGYCGFDLRQATTQAVPEAALQAATLVQRPGMVPMGDRASTAPVDEMDLAKLVRLCLLPGPGREAHFGLTGPDSALSVADRVNALERLGTALDGRRLDSARLRALVVQRWPGLSQLPESAVLPTLEEAAMEVELDADVTRLLCQGDEQRREASAAQLFGGHPPQLMTSSDVARFLGLDYATLVALTRRHGLSKPEPGHGYDMDEVLALKRRVQRLCPPGRLDEVLGWSGAAVALVRLNLLTGLHAEDGSLMGVEPDSFAMLMSRVHSAISPRSQPLDDLVPLSTGRSFGMDAHAMAWAVAQVVGGSLVAVGWPAPFHLSELRVDGRRLQALAVPNAEVSRSGNPRMESS